jgi:hypothetical protein
MRFFLKCLNHFKIQTKFKFDLLPGFLNPVSLGIWSSSNNESCSLWSYLPHCKVWKHLKTLKYHFIFLKSEQVWILENVLHNWKRVIKGPVHCYSRAPRVPYTLRPCRAQAPPPPDRDHHRATTVTDRSPALPTCTLDVIHCKSNAKMKICSPASIPHHASPFHSALPLLAVAASHRALSSLCAIVAPDCAFILASSHAATELLWSQPPSSFLRCGCFITDSIHQPPSGPVIAATRTTPPPCYSMTYPLAISTTGPACHRCSPSTERCLLHPPWEPPYRRQAPVDLWSSRQQPRDHSHKLRLGPLFLTDPTTTADNHSSKSSLGFPVLPSWPSLTATVGESPAVPHPQIGFPSHRCGHGPLIHRGLVAGWPDLSGASPARHGEQAPLFFGLSWTGLKCHGGLGPSAQ